MALLFREVITTFFLLYFYYIIKIYILIISFYYLLSSDSFTQKPRIRDLQERSKIYRNWQQALICLNLLKFNFTFCISIFPRYLIIRYYYQNNLVTKGYNYTYRHSSKYSTYGTACAKTSIQVHIFFFFGIHVQGYFLENLQSQVQRILHV